MKEENKLFWNLEILIFVLMGIITIVEIYRFDFFQIIFNHIKNYSSWFIGLSFGFVFSNLINPIKETIKGKTTLHEKREMFFFFILNLIIMAIISGFVENITLSFFESLFIYFHVIFMQWIMIVYLFFKLKNNYEISAKYFLGNEIIVLIYSIIILIMIA